MITGMQARAARSMLQWGVRELAARAGISPSTVVAAEAERPVAVKSVEAIEEALVAAGIEFTNGEAPGVKLRLAKRRGKKR